MKMLAAIGIFLLISSPSLVRGVGPASDPFLGKWMLDPQSSRYAYNNCPEEMTIEMTREAQGVHYHSHTKAASGEAFDVDYTANYDGKPALVRGSKGILLPISLERKGKVLTATYYNAFQVAATSVRSLSEDNRTMTITTISYDSMRPPETNVGVYRRQPDKEFQPAPFL